MINYNVEGQLEKINMYIFRVLKFCETLGIYTCIVYLHSNRVSAWIRSIGDWQMSLLRVEGEPRTQRMADLANEKARLHLIQPTT